MCFNQRAIFISDVCFTTLRNPSYIENEEEVCVDVNECETENECHYAAGCKNTIGSYQCSCYQGYYGDGKNCFDVDECMMSIHNCAENANCVNYEAYYQCEERYQMCCYLFLGIFIG